MQPIGKTRMPSDSILREKEDLEIKCQLLEEELPSFMQPFFRYLVDSFEPKSRLAYLREAKRFVEYLDSSNNINSPEALDFGHISIDQIDGYLKEGDRNNNGTKALLRKKSIINTLFKQLSSASLVNKEVAENVGKISVKPQSFSVVKESWQDLDRVLEGVKTGVYLSDKERQYWEKTKDRDYLILLLFGRLGLLLQEVYHLDLGDIDWEEKQLRIYGKGGQEEWISFDETIEEAIKLFLSRERNLTRVKEEALLLSLKGLRLSKRQLREITKKYTAAVKGKHRDQGLSPQRLRGINQKDN